MKNVLSVLVLSLSMVGCGGGSGGSEGSVTAPPVVGPSGPVVKPLDPYLPLVPEDSTDSFEPPFDGSEDDNLEVSETSELIANYFSLDLSTVESICSKTQSAGYKNYCVFDGNNSTITRTRTYISNGSSDEVAMKVVYHIANNMIYSISEYNNPGGYKDSGYHSFRSDKGEYKLTCIDFKQDPTTLIGSIKIKSSMLSSLVGTNNDNFRVTSTFTSTENSSQGSGLVYFDHNFSEVIRHIEVTGFDSN